MERNISPFDSINRIWRFIPGYTKIQFASAFIIGLLVHFYLMTNGFINHDSAMITEYYQWILASTGRWFAIIPDMISGSFNLMWLNALFALIYLSISVCLIGACLEIRRTPLVLLLSGIVVSFPAVAGWLSYRFVSDIAFFAVLLACLAIFLAKRYKFGFLFGAALLLFSVATYQATIGFFAGVMMLILIRDIFGGQETKTIVISAVKYLATLFIGLVAYVGTLNLPFYANLTTYKEIGSMGGFTIQSLPERLIFSYQNFTDVFFRNTLKLHQDYTQSGHIFQYLFAIAAIAMLALIVYLIINKKIYLKIPRLILLLVFIALLPPACNAISILSPNNLYILMQHSLALFFAFILMIIDISVDSADARPTKDISKLVYLSSWYLLVFCFVLIVNYTIYSNVFYQKLELVNKQGQSFSSTLVTKLKSEDFYNSKTRIVLYGEAPQSFALGYFEYNFAIPLGDIPNMYSYPAYLMNYFDLQNPVSRSNIYLPEEIDQNEAAMEAIKSMPAYPEAGSIAVVEGFIVVKFSD